MRRKIVNVPIYNHKVTFLQGNIDTILTYLSHIYTRDLDRELDVASDDASALCFFIDGDIYIWCNNDCDIAILGHELIHATYFIMKSRGLTINDQETFCYI